MVHYYYASEHWNKTDLKEFKVILTMKADSAEEVSRLTHRAFDTTFSAEAKQVHFPNQGLKGSVGGINIQVVGEQTVFFPNLEDRK